MRFRMIFLAFVAMAACLMASVAPDLVISSSPPDGVYGASDVVQSIDSLSSAVAPVGTLPWMIVSVVLGLFVLVQTIVRITPTPADDLIVSKIGKVLNIIFNKTRIKGEEARRTLAAVDAAVVARLNEVDYNRARKFADDAATHAVIHSDSRSGVSGFASGVAMNAVTRVLKRSDMKTKVGKAIKAFIVGRR